MEILILHPGALGDTILALPAVQLLRFAFPSARITLAGNLDHLEFIVSGYVDRVRSLSGYPLHRLYSPDSPTEADVRFWKSYDRIVSWTGAADPDFCRNLKAIHPDACIASWNPAPEDTRHVARIFADSIHSISGCNRKLEPVRIAPGAAAQCAGRQWLLNHGWNGREALTAIHPGSGGEWKRWPLPRFLELARRLTLEEKRKLVIVEGPAEEGIAQQFLSSVPASDLILCEGAGLHLLAGILTHCERFVGNDSGIAHLAAALGLHCTVLFGPTSPKHWAPFVPHVTIHKWDAALNDIDSCSV